MTPNSGADVLGPTDIPVKPVERINVYPFLEESVSVEYVHVRYQERIDNGFTCTLITPSRIPNQ
jgi:hypothetical protein